MQEIAANAGLTELTGDGGFSGLTGPPDSQVGAERGDVVGRIG